MSKTLNTVEAAGNGHMDAAVAEAFRVLKRVRIILVKRTYFSK